VAGWISGLGIISSFCPLVIFVWRYFSKGILASFTEHLGWDRAYRRYGQDRIGSYGFDWVGYCILSSVEMLYHLQTFFLNPHPSSSSLDLTFFRITLGGLQETLSSATTAELCSRPSTTPRNASWSVELRCAVMA
jgi:hypothetical protein